MLEEIDQDASGSIEYFEFVRLIRKIQSGNMAYVGVTTKERGPGQPNPPQVDPNLLRPLGQVQAGSNINAGQFQGLIESLKGGAGAVSIEADINAALLASQGQVDANLRAKLRPVVEQYNVLQG